MRWRRKALSFLLQSGWLFAWWLFYFSRGGCFAWCRRPTNLNERALAGAPSAVVTLDTDAPGKQGRGATLGEQFAQGTRPREAANEGVSRKELWALGRALSEWGSALIDNVTAVACANIWAGSSAPLGVLAGSIKCRELSVPCKIAPLRIREVQSSVADPYPGTSASREFSQSGGKQVRSYGCGHDGFRFCRQSLGENVSFPGKQCV